MISHGSFEEKVIIKIIQKLLNKGIEKKCECDNKESKIPINFPNQ